MIVQPLKNYVMEVGLLSEKEAAEFCSMFEYRTVNKREFLLRAGSICSFEAFVLAGMFKTYHLDEKGVEQILYFSIENWWLADIDSFKNQLPSQLNIQAIEDSEILIISKKDKERAYTQFPGIERLFRIMTQNAHVALQRRMIENLSATADQRYLNFITRYPQIALRLTNVQIAAYLGISHEFVSRIRKKITKTGF